MFSMFSMFSMFKTVFMSFMFCIYCMNNTYFMLNTYCMYCMLSMFIGNFLENTEGVFSNSPAHQSPFLPPVFHIFFQVPYKH